MSAPVPSRVFRVVVTQEVIVVVSPHAELVTVTEGLLRATGADQTGVADFGAIVSDGIEQEDCGNLVWITAGGTDVGDVVELTAGGEA